MTRRILAVLLGTYLLVVLVASQEQFAADEGTYVTYATNLTQGFFTSADPKRLDLRDGPGYPLVLAPFVALRAPWLAAKALNALLLAGGMLLLHQTLRVYVPPATARWGTLLTGLYPPFLRYIHQLMTETLAVFLACAFVYLFCRALREARSRWWAGFGAAVALAGLALTRVLFGYVILVMLLICLTGLGIRRLTFQRPTLVFALAMLLCAPYLAYTWKLTGRAFYWSNSGGSALYWLASPYDGELGDWQNDWRPLPANSRVQRNHQAFLDSLAGLGTVARSDALERRALRNIRSHPDKYIQNWLANLSRLFFSFPYTDTPQKLSTLFYVLPNVLLLALCGASLVAWRVARRPLPSEVHLVLFVGLVAIAGTSVGSASPRYLIPLIPFFVLWSLVALSVNLEVRVSQRRPASPDPTAR